MNGTAVGRLPRLVALVIAAAFVLGACGGDESDDSGISAAGSTPEAPLPPGDVESLAAIYDPLVEQYDVRFTRGALVDLDEGYLESPTGTHLALYVEPVDDESYTTAEYIEGMYEITELTAIHAFETWSGLESYDICQEPWQSEDSSLTPFPLTQIDITREVYETFDWENGTLPELLDHIDEDPDSRWLVSPSLINTPEFQEINGQRTVETSQWGQ